MISSSLLSRLVVELVVELSILQGQVSVDFQGGAYKASLESASMSPLFVAVALTRVISHCEE